MKRFIVGWVISMLCATASFAATGETVFGDLVVQGDISTRSTGIVTNSLAVLNDASGTLSGALTRYYRVSGITSRGKRIDGATNTVSATFTATNDAVQITWPKLKGVKYYAVELSTDGGSTYDYWSLQSLSTTSYVDTGANTWTNSLLSSVYSNTLSSGELDVPYIHYDATRVADTTASRLLSSNGIWRVQGSATNGEQIVNYTMLTNQNYLGLNFFTNITSAVDAWQFNLAGTEFYLFPPTNGTLTLGTGPIMGITVPHENLIATPIVISASGGLQVDTSAASDDWTELNSEKVYFNSGSHQTYMEQGTWYGRALVLNTNTVGAKVMVRGSGGDLAQFYTSSGSNVFSIDYLGKTRVFNNNPTNYEVVNWYAMNDYVTFPSNTSQWASNEVADIKTDTNYWQFTSTYASNTADWASNAVVEVKQHTNDYQRAVDFEIAFTNGAVTGKVVAVTDTLSVGGSNVMTYVASVSNASLQNVVEDTTPQLGGALDGQANVVTNVSKLFASTNIYVGTNAVVTQNRTISPGPGILGGGSLNTNLIIAADIDYLGGIFLTSSTNFFDEVVVANGLFLHDSLMSNGDFTSTNGWILTNMYVSGNYLIAGNGNTNATMTPNTQYDITNGYVYRLEWAVNSVFGTGTYSMVFEVGGWTRTYYYGYVNQWLTNAAVVPVNNPTDPFRLTINKESVGAIYMDNFSLSRIYDGDLYADDVYADKLTVVDILNAPNMPTSTNNLVDGDLWRSGTNVFIYFASP